MSDREAPGGSEAIPSETSQLPDGQMLPNASSYDGFAAFYREHMPRLVSLLVLQGAQLADATDIARNDVTRVPSVVGDRAPSGVGADGRLS